MKKRCISFFLSVCLLISLMSLTALAATDSKAPVIDKQSISISSESATVGDIVTVTVKVTDNEAVSRVSITFWNNDTSEQHNLSMLRKGDTDLFSCQFVVTEYTPSGTWRIHSILAYDTTDNSSSIYFSDNENTFSVVGTSSPMTIRNEDVSIDKSTATVGDTITISVKVGSEKVKRVSLDLINRDSGRQDHFLEMQYDTAAESYIYRLKVVDTLPSGYWEIGFINASDEYGYGIAEFVGNSKTGFTIIGTTADTEAPVVDNTTLSFSKLEIDQGESSVISVKITDNIQVGRVVFSIRNEETGKLLAYPNMTYNAETDRYEYVFVADDTIPSGHWKLCSIHACDTTNNLNLQSYYSWDYFILVKGENNHVWQEDKAIEPTCTRTGLTAGSSCSICGKVNIAQQIIDKKPHSFTNKPSYQKASDATCTDPATYYVRCDNCTCVSDSLTTPVGFANGHRWKAATCTEPKTCISCGAIEGIASGHNFISSQAYCTNGCGMKNPDYIFSYTPSHNPSNEQNTDKSENVKNPFADVKADDYFYDAVMWAVNKGIALGATETSFNPSGISTRAEMITFLWRAAGMPESSSDSTSFSDISESNYYYKAVLWATEIGIVKGSSATVFDPDAACTRAQAVTFLYRFAGVNSKYSNNTFVDINASNYYSNAVNWAANTRITVGTSTNAFSPNADCTRAQIITFPYRYMGK